MLTIFGQSDWNQRHGQRMRRKGSQVVHCPFQFRPVVDAGTEHHLTVEAHVMGGKAAEMLHDAVGMNVVQHFFAQFAVCRLH